MIFLPKSICFGVFRFPERSLNAHAFNPIGSTPMWEKLFPLFIPANENWQEPSVGGPHACVGASRDQSPFWPAERALEDGRQPFRGFFLNYSGRRQMWPALWGLVDFLAVPRF